jgi:hypothetical protein
MARRRQGDESSKRKRRQSDEIREPAEEAPGEVSGSRAGRQFDRFSDRARRVLARAEQEARRMRHTRIRPEHLLLALFAEFRHLLPARFGIPAADVEQFRARVASAFETEDAPAGAQLELTAECKRAIELAVDEARLLRHSQIGPEHLLIGVVQEGHALDQRLLTATAVSGLRLSRIATSVVVGPVQSLLPPGQYAPGLGEPPPALPLAVPGATRDNVLTIRVSDADLAAVDSLVEVGIMKSRSEAAAWLLGSGVAANRPLFENARDIVGEVRRLREEAQRLAQEHTSSGGEPAAE